MADDERDSGAEPGAVAMAGMILLAPAEVGASVARRPLDGRVLAAFLFLLAIVLGSSLLTIDQQMELVHERTRAKLAEMPAESRARIEEFMTGETMRRYLAVSSCGVVVVGVPLLAFLLYLGQLVMGGRAGYGMVFSV